MDVNCLASLQTPNVFLTWNGLRYNWEYLWFLRPFFTTIIYPSSHISTRPKTGFTHQMRRVVYNVQNLPPPAIVALMRLSNSSSPRMANCKWRGVIRFTFRSLLALPANSRTWIQRGNKVMSAQVHVILWRKKICTTNMLHLLPSHLIRIEI